MLSATEIYASRIWAGYTRGQKKHFCLHSSYSQARFVEMHVDAGKNDFDAVDIAAVICTWAKELR